MKVWRLIGRWRELKGEREEKWGEVDLEIDMSGDFFWVGNMTWIHILKVAIVSTFHYTMDILPCQITLCYRSCEELKTKLGLCNFQSVVFADLIMLGKSENK